MFEIKGQENPARTKIICCVFEPEILWYNLIDLDPVKVYSQKLSLFEFQEAMAEFRPEENGNSFF